VKYRDYSFGDVVISNVRIRDTVVYLKQEFVLLTASETSALMWRH
jgi:hypothetical protein